MTIQEFTNFLNETTAWHGPVLLSELILLAYSIKGNIDLKNKHDKEYRLHLRKDFTTKDVSKVMIPPEVNVDIKNIFIKKAQDTIVNNYLINFFFELHKYFKPEDLSLLYYNVGDIEIKENTKLEEIIAHFKNQQAVYNTSNNKININGKDKEEAIYHELFHMATAYYDNHIDYCGFSQYIGNKDPEKRFYIGNGLNEGYTEIMANRYFNEELKNSGYEYFIKMAYKVEKIVGKDFMEKCYLHADLKSLINELSKYSSVEETMEFIKNMDFLLYHEDDQYHKGVIAINYINTCKRRIVLYLVEAYREKIKNDCYKFKIHPYEGINNFKDFALELFLRDPFEEYNSNNVSFDEYKKAYNSMCNALGMEPKYNTMDNEDNIELKNPF